METWAYCRSCSRWFYCPNDAIEELAAASCPVCATLPVAFQQRARPEHPAILVE